MKELRREIRKLPVKLTDDELRKAADNMVAKVGEIDQETALQARAKAEMKARLTTLQGEMRRFITLIQKREEERDVSVVFELNDCQDQVTFRRADNNEILGFRDPYPGELQAKMPLTEATEEVLFGKDGEEDSSEPPVTQPETGEKPKRKRRARVQHINEVNALRSQNKLK